MLKRFISIFLAVAVTALAAGCNGAMETEDVAYILIVGIDKTADGRIQNTYQVAIPREIAGDGGGGKGGGDEDSWVINNITADSPGDRRMLLNATMSRYPNISHCVAFIYSEELAREGIWPHLSYTLRSRELRETMFIIVVPGTAEEYIKRNKPKYATQISKFYEAFMISSNLSHYYIPSTVHDFSHRLRNGGGTPYAVYSAINPKTGEDRPAGQKTPEQKSNPYVAGGVPRTGTENPAEFLGLAVFRGDKMVGVLNNEETRAVTILQGDFTSSFVGLVDPLKPEKDQVVVNIRGSGKPKITAALHDDGARFDVQVKLDTEIQGISSGINYEAPEYRPLLEEQIANMVKGQIDFMIKHTQELGTDPVGFGRYLRPKFANTTVLDQTDLTTLYQKADIRVSVEVKVRLPGLLWRTTTFKD